MLLLTARDSVADRINGLDRGADDYLGKPFDLDEVAARLRALIRRAEGRSQSVLQWQNVTVELSSRNVEKDGVPIRLSRREFSILRALMSHPAQFCPRPNWKTSFMAGRKK